ALADSATFAGFLCFPSHSTAKLVFILARQTFFIVTPATTSRWRNRSRWKGLRELIKTARKEVVNLVGSVTHQNGEASGHDPQGLGRDGNYQDRVRHSRCIVVELHGHQA
ncbi:uncharacterized protein EI90DRAFT_3288879, partial [Cantharellus anzutake]|uniref:uncharacterized protein n=1 Tax=Cantharellus anzutake TaxID=1750568 RepID=UPI00190715D1